MGLAELRAMRAYYYWQICDNFGDAPLVTTTTMELPSKSNRKEIFDFIVKELKEIIPSLSEEQGGNFYGRMNKWAAKTLLANIYLNAKVYTGEEHWDDCIQQCDDIINSNRFALSDNYKDPFRSTGVETSKEVIFTIPFDANIAGGNSIHMFSWHGELKKKYETEATPWGCGSAMGVTQFIDTYDPEDSRLADSWLMGEQRAADGSPLYGTYDKMGEPLVYTKDLPDGNYTSEMEGFRMNKFEIVKGAAILIRNGCASVPIRRSTPDESGMLIAFGKTRIRPLGHGSPQTGIQRQSRISDSNRCTVTRKQFISIWLCGTLHRYRQREHGPHSVRQNV